MSINLLEQDKADRQYALDAMQSFIVQAPAGSGKTELLIQRLLTLLQYVKAPEEILAITFTKKAANEMRLRIIKALKNALSDNPPESAHAKQTWELARSVLARDKQFNWNIIQNPNQLRIQTIDSLCAYLTKQLPLLSHFGSAPDIADNPATLYREAVQEVMLHVEENYAWSQAISNLLLHLDNDYNKLHDLLVSLLEKRDQWLPYIPLDTNNEQIKAKLELHLGLVISDSLTALIEIFPKTIVNELLELARFAANNLALTHPQSEICACSHLQKLPSHKPQDKPFWLAFAKLLLTDEGEWRKRVDTNIGFPAPSATKNNQEKILFKSYKDRFTELIATLQDNDNVRLALAELPHLPNACYSYAQWEVLQSLLVVLKIMVAQLRITFQQHGKIDFIENAQAALAALGTEESPTDLALALDYQIKHILVDEFQDTSFSQYQLIEKLTMGWEENDGRTLFVVGDPMQSIYRFRQAEVGLFIRMRKNGIGHIRLIPLTLAINFRAIPDIVDWNNALFKAIFPNFNDIATGAVTYSPSIANQQTNANFSKAIEVVGFVDQDDNLFQVNHIVQLISELTQLHPDDKIAILVRSRSHLSALIPALKHAKLPFRAVDIDPLVSKQHIQDVLSLTCALLHPADRIAWLSLLRAPWAGLTLADLLVIAGSSPTHAIWEQLNNPLILQNLSSDGQLRLMCLLPTLKAKMLERERQQLRNWIESTWLLLGGPACLHEEADMEDIKAYFNLLDEFSQHYQTLNLDKLKEKIKTLYASNQNEDAKLQIMTIHTAKGLEFDNVNFATS